MSVASSFNRSSEFVFWRSAFVRCRVAPHVPPCRAHGRDGPAPEAAVAAVPAKGGCHTGAMWAAARNVARTRVFSGPRVGVPWVGEGTHTHVVPKENTMTTNASTAIKNVTVRFFPNDKGNPAGKLADAEIHFADGVFAGLKLIGFALWERKNGGRNVTFPARQYSINGERR